MRDDFGAFGKGRHHLRVGGPEMSLELGPNLRDLNLQRGNLLHKVPCQKPDGHQALRGF